MALPSTTADRDRRKLAVFALLLLCFLLYAPSLGSDFVWDDRDAATAGGSGRNPLVAELRPLGDYLRGNWWPQRNPYAETYRPLTTYSFAVRHALCGDHALVAHLWSVLLHTLGVGLVFQLLRNLGAAFAPAWLGAAVFGLHALHGEAVLTIVGQAELLALVFGLLGTGACLRAVAAGSGAWRWWIAAAMAFTAACFSKESAVAWSVVTPACVAIAQQAHHRTTARRTWLALALVLGAPVLLFLTLRARMLAGLPPNPFGHAWLDNPLAHLDGWQRLASALLTWGHGLWLSLLPWRLAIDYGPGQLPLVTRLDDPWLLAAGAAALVMLGMLWHAAQLRRRPLTALAAIVFLAFTLPLSNLLLVVFMRFAERTYLMPTLATALLATWLLQRAGSTAARRFTCTLAAAWLLLSAGIAWQRIFVWRDDRTIITHGLAESPDNLRLRLCAGSLALRDGDPATAREHFAHAARVHADAPQPWYELAKLALRAGDRDGCARALAAARAGNAREVARHRNQLDALAAQLAAAAPR